MTRGRSHTHLRGFGATPCFMWPHIFAQIPGSVYYVKTSTFAYGCRVRASKLRRPVNILTSAGQKQKKSLTSAVIRAAACARSRQVPGQHGANSRSPFRRRKLLSLVRGPQPRRAPTSAQVSRPLVVASNPPARPRAHQTRAPGLRRLAGEPTAL